MRTIADILGTPDNRPEHPDMDLLSDIILALKAEMQEHQGDLATQERLWKAHYEALGDFDSIAYSALQAGIHLYGVNTGADYFALLASPRGESFVKVVQAFFDGFVMGAEFVKRKDEPRCDFDCDVCRGDD